MADIFSNHTPGLDSPASYAASVTPSDDTDLATHARVLYVGGAGDLQVTTSGGNTVTFIGVPAGTVLPIRVARVWDTDTDATNIVAIW